MYGAMREHLTRPARRDSRGRALYKGERVMTTPQRRARRRRRAAEVLNFCANNYLGLADHPEVVAAAHEALDRWGYGLASRPVHLRHAGAPQAAGGRASPHSSAPRTRSSTPPASTPTAGCSRRCSATEDAVICDELNHACIIDGIRLCKAQRLPLSRTTTWPT